MFGRSPAAATETSGNALANAGSRRKWGLRPSHFPSQCSQRGLPWGRLRMQLRKSKGNSRLEKPTAPRAGEEGSPPEVREAGGSRPGGPVSASPPRARALNVCPPLAKVSSSGEETHGIYYRSINLWLGKVS